MEPDINGMGRLMLEFIALFDEGRVVEAQVYDYVIFAYWPRNYIGWKRELRGYG